MFSNSLLPELGREDGVAFHWDRNNFTATNNVWNAGSLTRLAERFLAWTPDGGTDSDVSATGDLRISCRDLKSHFGSVDSVDEFGEPVVHYWISVDRDVSVHL